MSSNPAAGTFSAGSRRFWTTILCFAAANCLAWVGYHHYATSRLYLLRVEQFEPGPGATVSPRGAVLTWRFNLDVPRQAGSVTQPPGTLSPHVRGTWRWNDLRTLTFVPDEDLPRATRFSVALAADRLRTPEGARLVGPYTTTVQTAALEVRSITQRSCEPDGHVVLELCFSDRVLPADLARHLSIQGPDGRQIAFQPHGEAAGQRVLFRTDAIPALAEQAASLPLTVEVSAGLAGTAGPLGLQQPCAVRLNVALALAATEAHAYWHYSGDARLRICFNREQVDLESIRQVLSIEPALPYTLSQQGGDVTIQADFQPGQRYAVKLAAPPPGADLTKFPRSTVLSTFLPDRSPRLWFEHSEGYLGSSGNRTLLAHAVNHDGVRIAVTRVYDNNLVAWRNGNGRMRQWAGTGAFSQPLTSRTIALTGKKNQTQELRLSLDDLLPADAPRDGVYRIALSAAEPRPSGARRWQPSVTIGSRGDEEDEAELEDDGPYCCRDATTIVTLSDVGLSARQTRDSVFAWAVSLSTGKPLGDVRLRLYSNKNQLLGECRTGPDGLARLTAPKPAPGERPAVLLAERTGPETPVAGEALAASATGATRGLTWLDLSGETVATSHLDTGGKPYLRTGFEAFCYSDRGVYRPGETVHLRAILRGPEQQTPAGFPVRWQLRRPDLRDWKAEIVRVDADGAAALDLPLPADLATGRWTADLSLPGESNKGGHSFGSVTFLVEEFMPNRMKLALDVLQKDKPVERVDLTTGPVAARVRADYLFGKPVAQQPATLAVRVDPVPFTAAKWAGWTFHDAAAVTEALTGASSISGRIELDEATTDVHGKAEWELDADDLRRARPDQVTPRTPRGRARNTPTAAKAPATQPYSGPWRVALAASVCEEGGRAVTIGRTVTIDAVPYYVGIRPTRPSAVPGESCAFELAFVSPAGESNAAGGSLKVLCYREVWNTTLLHEEGRYRYQSTRKLEPAGPPQDVRVDSGRGTCTVRPTHAGAYVLYVKDAATGCVASHRFYASAGAWEDNVSREDPEHLEVVLVPAPALDPARLLGMPHHWATLPLPDPGADVETPATPLPPPSTPKALPDGKAPEPTFRVGQRAMAIVRSPFRGQLLLTIETDGIVQSRVIDMPASHVAVPLDVTEACRPNAYVTAVVLRAVDPDAKWRTHRAYGIARLNIENIDRKLNVAIDAPTEVRPDTTLSAHLRVTDAAGKPAAGAAVTVAAVDEGICQLTSFAAPDPFAFFYGAKRAHGVRWADIYSQLMPEVARPGRSSETGGDADGAGEGSGHRNPVSAKRVKSVAMVSAVLHADADGWVRADFPIPQFAGQVRLMAVAHSAKAMGSAAGNVLVRSPLLVQSSWPRFAAPGDRFAVPLVLFNQTGSAGKAEVAIEFFQGDDGRPNPLEFAAGKEHRMVLHDVAVPKDGQAKLSVEVVAGQAAGVGRALVVATLNGQTFTESVELPVRPASPAITTGGYLVAKPGEPLKVGLPADGAMLPGTGEIQVRVTNWPTLEIPQGLDYLDRYPYGCAEQTISTSFPLIALGDLGARLAPGLFDPQRVQEKLQSGITRLIGMQTADGGIAMWGGERRAWPWATVYAAHFLVEAQRSGHKVPEEFRNHLLDYVQHLLLEPSDEAETVETQAYASYVLALAGRPPRAVMNRLSEIIAHPIGERSLPTAQARFHLAAAWLAAGRRDLATNLIPQSIPQPRVNRQLSGNVGSPARERAIILSSLLEIEPEHAALPALAQELADLGQHGGWYSTQDTALAVLALGRYVRQAKEAAPFDSAELRLAKQPVATAGRGATITWHAAAADGELELRVTGPQTTKAHVSWLQNGVPLAAPADVDSGLKIRRRYLDAKGQPLADVVRSGDLVQVEITIEAAAALPHVVVDDLLPAGLEIENPHLATSADATVQVTDAAKEKSPEFQPTKIDARDDRMILVGHLSGAGVGRFVYVARAVAPGTFVVPPVKGKCMYDISTRSIHGGGRLLRVTGHDTAPTVADTDGDL